VKTRTAALAIFLTLTRAGLFADAATSDIQPISQENSTTLNESQTPEIGYVVSAPEAKTSLDSTTEQTDSSAAETPDTKYVSEENASNSKNKDNSTLYNFLLALAAIAVATAAIILVSSNKGSKVDR
jgi:ABC-type Na+ efflux pump permease subunit